MILVIKDDYIIVLLMTIYEVAIVQCSPVPVPEIIRWHTSTCPTRIWPYGV